MLGIASVDCTFLLLCLISFYQDPFHCNFHMEFIFANIFRSEILKNKCHKNSDQFIMLDFYTL